jgi:hypothetical protein
MSRLHRVGVAVSGRRRAAALLQALAALALGGGVALPAWAVSCDALRASVEAKIRRNGVSDFSVSVIDANKTPNGRVVGSCELGTKKLVYVPGSQAVAPVAAPTSPPLPSPSASLGFGGERMIVECFDGKVYTEGPCKK